MRPASTVVRRHRLRLSRSVTVVAVTGAALFAGGCSKSTSGVAAGPTIQGLPVSASLAAIPATTQAKYLIDISDLDAIGIAVQHEKHAPSSTSAGETSHGTSGTTRSDPVPWSEGVAFAPTCSFMAYTQFSSSGPLPVLHSSLTVELDAKSSLSVCATDQATGAIPGLSTAAKADSRGGVQGSSDGDYWIGRLTEDRLAATSGDIQDSMISGVADGHQVSGNLAEDPDVKAVLAAVPDASRVTMGSFMISVAASFDTSGVKAAVQQGESKSGKTLPKARFGGYAFTLGSGGSTTSGSGRFVAVYDSPGKAADAVAVLNAIWPTGTGFGKDFPGITSSATGSVVVTTLPQVSVRRFNLRLLDVGQFPGWHPTEG